MTESNLPPLPQTSSYKHIDGAILRAFTSVQMLEYGQLCRQQGLEDAVKAVDDAGGDNCDYHMQAIKELK